MSFSSSSPMSLDQITDLADPRAYPTDEALSHVGHAIMTEVLDIILDTPLEDHAAICESLLGGLHTGIQRLERDADRARDEINRGVRDFDGSEVADTTLQEATQRARSLDAAVAALERMRDSAAQAYTCATAEVWSPWKGTVRQSTTTAALIDAKDALRAHKADKHSATSPGASVVGFRASPQAVSEIDASRIFDALNWAKTQYPAMVLATTGLKGAEKIAMRWAQQKGVKTVLAKADFNRHGPSAPFRANDAILGLDPVHVITLPHSLSATDGDHKSFGPALNMAQEAMRLAIRHTEIRMQA